jgi:hypothetical protein
MRCAGRGSRHGQRGQGYGGGQRGVRRRDALGRGQGGSSVCMPPRDGARALGRHEAARGPRYGEG